MNGSGGYPENPPFAPSEFDRRDRAKFAAAYYWAGSAQKLHDWLDAGGILVPTTTLNDWRRRHKLQVASEGHRLRTGVFETAQSFDEAPPADDVDHTAVLRELFDWLRTRERPIGTPPAIEKPRRGGEWATEIVGSDVHFPYYHEGAFEVFLGTIAELQPDGVTLNGDVFDFNQISRFIKNPAHFTPIQDDVDQARELLARVETAAPEARRTLVWGNHEITRWENYLWTHAPAIASLRVLDFETLMGLNEIDWNYCRDGFWLIPDVLVLDHGSRHTNALGGGSAGSARKEMLDVGTSGASGHTHKMGMFFRQDGVGYRVWAEGGCLCDQDKMRAAAVTARKRGPAREDWHLGFLKIDYRIDGEAFVITPIPVLENDRRVFTYIGEKEISFRKRG